MKLDRKDRKNYPEATLVRIVYEWGGGLKHKGDAGCVCSILGEPLVPYEVNTGEGTENKVHAKFWGEAGTIIVNAWYDTKNPEDKDFTIEVFQLNDECEAELLFSYSAGEWDEEPPVEFEEIISATKEKAVCFNCTHLHYVAEK